MKKVILASGSPRRKELLEQIGIKFEVCVSEQEERYESTNPGDIVKELAQMKAENVYQVLLQDIFKGQVPGLADVLIIGADTVVAAENQILGKPKDEAEAFSMISKLQGRMHQVFTGVVMLDFDHSGTRSIWCEAVETKVYVSAMKPDEIRDYVASGEAMDKAGGYGIQGRFAAFIEKIDGDYYNVVGLPVSRVYQQWKKQNDVMLKGKKMEEQKEKRLESFEKMQRSVQREFEDICAKMEQQKQQGKVKSVTYHQLIGRKVMYTNMLDLYKLYDL